MLKGLCKLNETQRNDATTVISLWRYEVFSTIGDQLPRYSDLYWFESVVKDLIKEVMIHLIKTTIRLILISSRFRNCHLIINLKN